MTRGQTDRRRAKAASIRHLLQTEGESIREQSSELNANRYAAAERVDEFEALREQARELKEDAIASLPTLIDTLRSSVEANGGTLYLADDAADANSYIASIAADHDAETLVKSKSMTTEELEVNDHLIEAGVDVYETDLGEFVIQVADESPSHLVGPAMHKSREEIARLFNTHFDPPEPLKTAEDLTRFARDYLGERIKEADIGMTGANFVLADSGTLVLVTNEGNARKCAVTPDVHVAVTGIEKLLPSVTELEPFVELIARSATGQDIAQYVSLLTPPVETPTLGFEDPDVPAAGGDREFHLVLVDNGRSDLLDDEQLRETLYCIRCGACANSCANFQAVGGHAFGGETYTGGIATGWETGVHGLDSAAEFNDLCTGCSRCVPACPVKIDIPWINTVVRDRINRDESGTLDFLVEGLTPDAEPGGLDLQKRLFGNVATLARLGSATAPVSNWVANTGVVRSVLASAVGIDRRRDLPEFQRETLGKWFDRRGGTQVRDAKREVVLYPDTYTNHVRVERGKAAVRVLEALGVAVRIPDLPESGRAPLSQGMIATAKRRAHAVFADLAEHLDAGRDVVVVEPSDLAMFRREYEKFLPPASFERLAGGSYECMEYVYGLLENGGDPDVLEVPDDLAYHSHCQQRTLGLERYTTAVFERLGVDVVTADVECCGMAGSFGYKTEYYELSQAVGEPLAERFADASDDRQVVASGTSCAEQLEGLLGRSAPHPMELLDPGVGNWRSG